MDYENIPEYVNVGTMAKMLHISRSRLYQLIEQSILLRPKYIEQSKRPVYTKEMIIRNLEVKRNNVGINGTVVMFYSQRLKPNTKSIVKQPKQSSKKQNDKKVSKALLEDLQSLGLTEISAAEVEDAMSKCYPNGTDGVDEDDILTTIFRHIKRQNTEHKPRM